MKDTIEQAAASLNQTGQEILARISPDEIIAVSIQCEEAREEAIRMIEKRLPGTEADIDLIPGWVGIDIGCEAQLSDEQCIAIVEDALEDTVLRHLTYKLFINREFGSKGGDSEIELWSDSTRA